MHLVISPAIDESRLLRVRHAAGSGCRVTNAADLKAAREAMPTADAFFGQLTPELLAASTQLRWVQSPTASLEHYLFPALVEHPCQLTNKRPSFFPATMNYQDNKYYEIDPTNVASWTQVKAYYQRLRGRIIP